MVINVVLYDSTLLSASKKNIVMTSELVCISIPPFSEIKTERKRQPLFVQTQDLQETKANFLTKAYSNTRQRED